jgi:hypothetical protein
MKTKQKHINNVGAAYFAVNYLGWATAATPWGALAKLDLNMSGKRSSVGSKAYDEQTEGVRLYYLPDESKFAGTDEHRPVDASGQPYGTPLYIGRHTGNEKIVKDVLAV